MLDLKKRRLGREQNVQVASYVARMHEIVRIYISAVTISSVDASLSHTRIYIYIGVSFECI